MLEDKMKKFEPKYRLKRAGLGGDKGGSGRRSKKDTKNRMKKVCSGLGRYRKSKTNEHSTKQK